MNRAWIVWVGLAAALTGCTGSQTEKVQARPQIGEDPADRDALATVGMKTTPSNTEPIPVSGVGLVYRLAGTGSNATTGGWRTMLENSLKKQGFSNLRELLDDPARTTSLVLVSALIPPGARKGEMIDVQISLPEDSKTSSLKGGVLLACELYNYDTTGNLQSLVREGKPSTPRGDLKLGSVWARAEGPVVAGAYLPAGAKAPAEGENDPPALKAGRVWGGGRVAQHRPYYFLMNPGDQNARMAGEVAERLNATFSTGDPNLKVAEFKTRELVLVHVPPAYRHDHYRYLVVARQVPIVPVAADSLYRRKLEDELLDPATALRAAVRLEAAGGDNLRALRIAKENPSPWVRFAAAESLAYLGQTDGAAELARLAEDHPALRAQCLKALASMDDASFTDRLVELMGHTDPILRYGAFVALRLADENNPAVKGLLLNHSFWLHRVAPGSPGMVHLTGDRRSEIVVFGDGVQLKGPVPPLPVGSDFTVSLPAGEAEAKVTRVIRTKAGDSDVKEVRCKPDLGEVIATIGRLGGGYGDAVEFLRRADSAQLLTASVVIDALPRQFTIQQLAGFAKTDPLLLKANQDVAKIGTVRPDIEQAGYNLPADQDPAAATDPAAVRPPLSRDPGRIFGPKRPPEPANAEGLTPVNPATPPPAAEPKRNPGDAGTLFPRK